MFRYRLLLPALVVATLLSGCVWQTPHGPTDLVPILCHKEIDRGMLKGTGVGILFITIENQGNDAGPAAMTVAYETYSRRIPRVQIEVKTPSIPAGSDIWISVDLPFAPGTTSILEPAGKISITVDSKNVPPKTMRASNILVTNCHDPT